MRPSARRAGGVPFISRSTENFHSCRTRRPRALRGRIIGEGKGEADRPAGRPDEEMKEERAAAIRGTETSPGLDRTREFDVPRREKEASKSENDLSCRLAGAAPRCKTSLSRSVETLGRGETRGRNSGNLDIKMRRRSSTKASHAT